MAAGRSRRLASAAILTPVLALSAPPDPPPTPSARNAFTLVYEAHHDRVLLFGGSDAAGERLADTWTWHAGRWTLLDVAGPPARSDAHMAYDARRGRTVLFGGMSATGRLADTWEFDGERWRRMATAGPPARSLGAMAYDAERGRVVLFGGSGEGRTRLGDTWEWDGARWTERSPADPVPAGRGSHAMAWHGGLGVVVLYGGWDGTRTAADLWAWDGDAWRELEAGAEAPARLHLAFDYDAASERLLAFGGFGEGREGDTWAWHAASGWSRIAAGGPPARAEHEGVWMPGTGFVVFGGITGQGMAVADRTKAADTWVWDGRLWRPAQVG